MRALWLLTVLLATTAMAASPATMRLDYYHSGNSETESFSVDRVIIEPLPFPGNLREPTDTTLRGKYVFEVSESATGKTLWSRSFSSIFGEWETTSEARELNRTFHESLRFPLPDKAVGIVLKKRDAQNRFVQIWRTEVDPADYLVHHESAAYANELVAVHVSGDPADKVDILLLGDGYTRDEQEAFIGKARELTALLFATAPFSSRQDDFNVWALAPVASQSGVSRPSTGIYRDSPLGARYDAFRSERYILTYDNREWRKIASSAPYDFVEILTNSDIYGGGGIYGLFSTAAANSEWAGYLFVHEFAHHFAGLADEYYTSSVAYEPPEQIIEPYEPNVTALLEPANLKWRHLVSGKTPLPTLWPKEAYEKHSLAYQARREAMRAENVPEAEMDALFAENQRIVESLFADAPYAGDVGAFEGAAYQSEGYFRPEQNCIMFTRTEAFCRVCASAIELVIDEYTK